MSPLVVWLGSLQSAHVTGRVFEVYGGHVGIVNGWDRALSVDKGDRWEPAELGPVVDQLLGSAREPDPFMPPA